MAVVDNVKHGLRLSCHPVLRPDLLVDSHDPQRAVEVMRANSLGQIRFGIDTTGRETASFLLQALSPGVAEPIPTRHLDKPSLPTPPATPQSSSSLCTHLVGLTGLPKQVQPEGTLFHTVPIKLFHEVPSIGRSLVTWLERLLEAGLIIPPEIIDAEHGLESVNKALDRMRNGEIRGGKLIVKLQ